MSRAAVRLEFAGGEKEILELQIGEVCAGTVAVHAIEPLKLNAINIEIGFRAHGRGDEDRVHQRVGGCGALSLEAGQSHRLTFEGELPDEGPMSWDGKVVKVTWEVQVHLDIPWAVDQYETFPFVVRPRGFFTRKS